MTPAEYLQTAAGELQRAALALRRAVLSLEIDDLDRASAEQRAAYAGVQAAQAYLTRADEAQRPVMAALIEQGRQGGIIEITAGE